MIVYLNETDTNVCSIGIDEVEEYYNRNSFNYGYLPTDCINEMINFYFWYNERGIRGKVIHIDYTNQEERKLKLLKMRGRPDVSIIKGE